MNNETIGRCIRDFIGAGLVFTACTQGPVDDELERASEPLLGHREFAIYEGASTQSDDVLAWSIGFSDVVRRSSSPTPQALGDDFEVVVVTFDETRMMGIDGQTCWFVGQQLVDGEGKVVLREHDGAVFEGDARRATLSFFGFKIVEGKNGPPLASSTANLRRAEPAARLLVAALILGVCGGDGL